MRCFRLLSLVAFLLLGTGLTARAATVDYTVSFTSATNGPSGSGTFTYDSSTSAITAASFTVNGETFTLNDAFLAPPTFDPSTNDLAFSDVQNPDNLALFTETGGYIFGYFPIAVFDQGTISIQPSVATTPEPSSLVLLGTGVLGSVAAMRRRLIRA